MLGTVLKKVFGSANDRRLKAYRPQIAAINALEPQLQALSDDELRARTAKPSAPNSQPARRSTICSLPEAFATVREAAKRALGQQRHFDVQLIGGMVLHEGAIAEMRTGEGKTLVATLPGLPQRAGRSRRPRRHRQRLSRQPRRRLDGPHL